MNAIELRNVSVKLDQKQVLSGVDLDIGQGEFMTFLGPSGCGKTTLLRTIAGLQRAEGGTIAIGGREAANGERGYHLEPAKRGLSLVFQSYALWPHMTVYDNVAFGLQVRRMGKSRIRDMVRSALEKVRIPDLADRYPSELSGGQQQRVAIARAIVTEPDILLLDEPLSNLDAKLRVEMRAELKRLHQELNTTVIYVTHDQHEAMTLSTRVAVFFGGQIVQVDKPRELYRRPRTLQVAEFVGNSGMAMNAVEGRIVYSGGQPLLKTDAAEIAIEGSGLDSGRELVMTIKPEDVRLHSSAQQGGTAAVVEAVFPAGAETLVQLNAGGARWIARTIGDAEYAEGDRLFVTLRREQMNFYDKRTGLLLEKTYSVQQSMGGLTQ